MKYEKKVACCPGPERFASAGVVGHRAVDLQRQPAQIRTAGHEDSAWNQNANVHLATTILSNQLTFWGITFL